MSQKKPALTTASDQTVPARDAAFTRGPWTVLPEEANKDYIRVRGTQLGHRYKVANVLLMRYEGVHEREAVESRANARLIAAAPQMLEAARCAATVLSLLHGEVDGLGHSANNVLPMLRAAIASALGEPSEAPQATVFNPDPPPDSPYPVPVSDHTRTMAALRDAATSLETIAALAGRKTYGDPPIDTHMSTFTDVRLYAAARARVAREALERSRSTTSPNEPRR